MKDLSHLVLLPVWILVLAGTACQGNDSRDKKDDIILTSERLIDEHRTDEAIYLLEGHLVTDSNNPRLRPTLASAYADKAGIQIHVLLPIVSQASEMQAAEDNLKRVLKEISDDNDKRTGISMIQFSALLQSLSSATKMYGSIPSLSKVQSTYLSEAIGILNDIGPTILPQDALYRAILEIIQFKNVLHDEFVGEISPKFDPNNINCRLNQDLIVQNLSDLSRIAIAIVNDIAIANPSQTPQLKTLTEQINNAMIKMKSENLSVTSLNASSNVFLKNAAMEAGFGKILECVGN